MKLRPIAYRSGVLASVILALAAQPGHAQFGGVVFDPTQSAHAIEQIQRNIQNSVTWQQQLANEIQMAATLDKDYQQAITTYDMIHGNLKNFSSKSIWQTIQSQLTQANFANQYGETTGLQASMNGQAPGTAGMVWKLMNLGLNATSSSFLSGQVLGASNSLAALTRMEAMDGVSSQCLNSVGSYNAARTGNLTPQTALTQSQFDTTSFTTTELEQLNLINMGNAHHLNESQAQGALHAWRQPAERALGCLPETNSRTANHYRSRTLNGRAHRSGHLPRCPARILERSLSTDRHRRFSAPTRITHRPLG